MPFTLGLHWYSPVPTSTSALASMPVFVAGICVGYYYRQKSKRAIRIGTRVGLVGALPALWVYSNRFAAGIDPSQTTAAEIGPLLGLVLLVAGLSMLQGFMGTLIGVKTKHRRPPTEAT